MPVCKQVVALAALVAAAAPLCAQEGLEATAGDTVGAALEGCRTDLVYLNQMFGWQVAWPREWSGLARASDSEIADAIARWREAPAALAAAQAALSVEAPGQRRAPAVVTERVLAQIRQLLADLRTAPPLLRADADPALRVAWTSLFADGIVPALDRYEAYLSGAYRPAEAAGLGDADCFRRAVTRFTTLDLPAEEIEAIGRRLLDRTEADLASLYGIPRDRLPALLASLREEREPGFDEDRLVDISRAAIARAETAMPLMFGAPAQVPVTVEPIPRQMEASFPAGFYQEGEGGAPAAYVINRGRPAERRLMAEVIAFHETLPGHHVRQALGLPVGDFNSGFAEGWAIYAEYLADEMGLYSGRLDRAGMMAKHLWAASRLVVEPGLHLRGWTREQAVRFMRDHTALSDAEIALEVDRYIGLPGQSLSYMLGYDRIAAARREAEQRLGAAFDLRRFHAIVLGPGGRPLEQMQRDVAAWDGR